MSFLFGSTKHVQAPEPTPLPPERFSSNQSARVLPWLAGTRWVAVSWVGDVFNVTTSEVRRKVGKKSQTVGHNYYASFAGLACGGPVDLIAGIKFDGQLVWDSVATLTGSDYVDITIPSRGILRVYSGTETQTLDSDLEDSGQNHSAYRGQCYVRGRSIFLGQDRTTVPNIELLLGRFPEPAWATTPLAFDLQSANPIYVLWDWWTDKRFGLGRPESKLDIARLQAAAEQCDADSLYVSPLLTSPKDMRELVTKLLEIIDGYPTSYEGKFGIELVREVAPTVTLNDTDFLRDPSISYQTWDDTYDEVVVKFRNFLKHDADDAVKHHDLANFRITGRHRSLSIDRDWVTNSGIAQRIADGVGRASGVPRCKGTISIRQSQATELSLGSVFTLSRVYGESIVCRVKERTEPAPDQRAVDIAFEEDIAWTNANSFATSPPPDPSDRPVFEPEPPYEAALIDAPYALVSDTINPSLIYMVARGDTISTSFDVWKASDAADGTYYSSSERRNGPPFPSFAVRAQIIGHFPQSDLTIDESERLTFQVLSPDQTPLESEWDLAAGLNHELLAFIDDIGTPEIVSLFELTKINEDTYTAKAVRGLYDTINTEHYEGQHVWIHARSRLAVEAWPPYVFLSRWYKFQPAFGTQEVALADIDPVLHIENGRMLRPIRPANFAANGDRFSASWQTGTDLVLTWENTSRARTAFGMPFTETPASDMTGVYFEIRSYNGENLLNSFELPTAPETYTLTSGLLAAVVGTSDFQIRLYSVRSGWRSLFYSSLLVRYAA